MPGQRPEVDREPAILEVVVDHVGVEPAVSRLVDVGIRQEEHLPAGIAAALAGAAAPQKAVEVVGPMARLAEGPLPRGRARGVVVAKARLDLGNHVERRLDALKGDIPVGVRDVQLREVGRDEDVLRPDDAVNEPDVFHMLAHGAAPSPHHRSMHRLDTRPPNAFLMGR